jgi:D-aminopeptidase
MVGHQTIRRDDLHTGVTAVMPHGGDLFQEKVPAAVEVINGFGKSVGLMQIEELGTLESPILLTNTFGVGTCANALIRRAIKSNPGIGRTTSTFNPVVLECNDGALSDIQAMAVTEADALAAIQNACDETVVQGSVGAGTGMRCFGYKGGIGTASRQVELDGKSHHLGILVNSNFGSAHQLILPHGWRAKTGAKAEPEKGSIIIVLATDVPLDYRQLRRVGRRCGAGLARLGSVWGHGSGDIVLAFSTAYRLRHDEPRDTIPAQMLNEARMDSLFAAAADATAEAVLNSMLFSPAITGRGGQHAPSLAEVIRKG